MLGDAAASASSSRGSRQHVRHALSVAGHAAIEHQRQVEIVQGKPEGGAAVSNTRSPGPPRDQPVATPGVCSSPGAANDRGKTDCDQKRRHADRPGQPFTEQVAANAAARVRPVAGARPPREAACRGAEFSNRGQWPCGTTFSSHAINLAEHPFSNEEQEHGAE